MEVGDEIGDVSVVYGVGGRMYEDDSGSDRDAYAAKGDEEAGGLRERKAGGAAF